MFCERQLCRANDLLWLLCSRAASLHWARKAASGCWCAEQLPQCRDKGWAVGEAALGAGQQRGQRMNVRWYTHCATCIRSGRGGHSSTFLPWALDGPVPVLSCLTALYTEAVAQFELFASSQRMQNIYKFGEVERWGGDIFSSSNQRTLSTAPKRQRRSLAGTSLVISRSNRYGIYIFAWV